MKVAICDDNAQDLACLSDALKVYDPSIEIACFSTALELYNSAQSEIYDAVLLDIEMEVPNGYEIALRLARQEAHPIILFVSNSADYAVRGYGLALRYILKPLKSDALAEAMDAVKQEIRGSRLSVTLEGATHILNVPSVHYVEVLGHNITLHTTDGDYSFRAPLKDLTEQLPSRFFCAPHQSYVVNMLHVKTVSAQEVRMLDGTSIPVSRRRYRDFLHSFHRFLGV